MIIMIIMIILMICYLRDGERLTIVLASRQSESPGFICRGPGEGQIHQILAHLDTTLL